MELLKLALQQLSKRAGDGTSQQLPAAAARGWRCGKLASSPPTPPPSSSSAPAFPPPTSQPQQGYRGVGIGIVLRSTHLATRGFTTLAARLPPLSELSYDQADSRPEVWVPILEYLKLHHDPFPDAPLDGSYTNQLSTDHFRQMQRDVVMLVALNRMRGYDLAQDLKPENVLVCIGTGRIRLRVVSGDVVTIPSEFKGYATAGALFRSILWTLYNGSKLLSEDNEHFHNLLASCLDDQRLVNHASLLSRFGRIGLTLRISMLVRNDLQKLVPNSNSYHMHKFFRSLPYTTVDLDVFPTDSMHSNFISLRKASEEFKDQDRTFERDNLRRIAKDPGWAWKSLTGNWLVSVNRNALMHPPWGFKQSQAVDQLHSHTPMYLPKAQESFRKTFGWWDTLEISNYFPEKKVLKDDGC